jgi:hypothetical protein
MAGWQTDWICEGWMFECVDVWLAGLTSLWVTRRMVGNLDDWLAGCLYGWQAEWLPGRVCAWLVRCLADWIAGWLAS